MHGDDIPWGYDLWPMVAINAAIFVLMTVTFLTPARRREWRSLGVFTAFVVALFTEMYGFPLTIYVLTALLGSRYPVLNPFSHAAGHLWVTFLGGGPLMSTVIHGVSNGLMAGGLVVMAVGWHHIHRARGELVTAGIYRFVRHPQYSGLFLISTGMLVQWPTIVTVLTWPALVAVYVRLARREEREAEERFGDAYRVYRSGVGMFLPALSWRGRAASTPTNAARIVLAAFAVALVALGVLLVVLSPQPLPPLPASFAGLPLTHALEGPLALDELARLHRRHMALRSGFVAHYERDGVAAMLYVSRAYASPLAGWQLERMVNGIRAGEANHEGRFVHLKSIERAGVTLYSALGLGRVHYFYRSGAVVVWVAADPRIARSALADATVVLRRAR